MIYEGANGVQALDLVGRKLPAEGGKAVRAFIDDGEGGMPGTWRCGRDGGVYRAAEAGLERPWLPRWGR